MQNAGHTVTLVTTPKDQDLIKKVGGDTEYKVKVVTIKEFNEIRGSQSKIDFYVETPLQTKISDNIIGELKIPTTAKIILCTEYSCNLAGRFAFEGMDKHLQKKGYSTLLIKTGLGLKKDKEHGIWLDKDLIEICKQRQKSNFGYRAKCLETLGKPAELLLAGQEEKYFFAHNDVSLQYGNQPQSFGTFLSVRQAMIVESKKNETILCVGRTSTDILEQIRTSCHDLIKSNACKIVYTYTNEQGEQKETIICDPKESSAKTLNIIHIPRLTHQQMLAALALSSFAGITGDQSLGEVMSLGIPFTYETLKHKIYLSNHLKDYFIRYIKWSKISSGETLIKIINFLYEQPTGLEDTLDLRLLDIMTKKDAEDCLKHLNDPKIVADLQKVFEDIVAHSKFIDLSQYLQREMSSFAKTKTSADIDSASSLSSGYREDKLLVKKGIFTVPMNYSLVPGPACQQKTYSELLKSMSTLGLIQPAPVAPTVTVSTTTSKETQNI